MFPPLWPLKEKPNTNILQNIVQIIKSNADDTYKVYNLIYLQESMHLFFENDIDSFYTLYEELVRILVTRSSVEDAMQEVLFVVDSQILVCLTTIIIELDIITKNATLFQNWTQFLLSIAAQPNRSINRVYRQMACESLQELEIQYPGLLSQYVFALLRWCQLECTHALQSYTNLMMITLDHWCQKVLIQYHNEAQLNRRHSTSSTASDSSSVISSSSSIKSTASTAPQIPTSFTIPPLLTATLPSNCTLTIPQVLPETKRELHQCLSFIVENVNLLTPWAKTSIMKHVYRLLPYTEFPQHVIKNSFKSFLYGANPLLVHMHSFHDKQGIERISIMNKDFSMPTYFRKIANHWLHCLMPNEYFVDHYGELYPTPFDEFVIKEAKILTLADCFQDSNEAPHNFLDVLVCMNDFPYYNKLTHVCGNKRLNAIFAFLRKVIRYYPAQEVFAYIYGLLEQERQATIPPQHYVMNKFTRLIALLKKEGLHQELLTLMETAICTQVSDITYYFPFIENIISEELIDPNRLLVKVYDFVRQKKVCEQGDWNIGDHILNCCRLAMITLQSTAHDFKANLEALITVCADYFNNIEIQDRAKLYRQLFAHLRGERLISLLSNHGELSLHRQSDMFSGNAEKPMVKQVPSCFSLTRVTTPNVDLPKSSPAPLSYYLQQEILEAYCTHINKICRVVYTTNLNAKSTGKPKMIPPELCIELKYSLKYKEQDGGIYGMTVDLSGHHAQHFTKMKSVKIPYIGMNDPVYQVGLTLVPVRPLPGSFDVTAQFTAPLESDLSNAFCTTTLDSVHLNLQDLFLPVPLPITLIQTHGTSIDSALFEALWEAMYPPSQVQPMITSPTRKHKRSVSLQRASIPSKTVQKWYHSIKVLPITESVETLWAKAGLSKSLLVGEDKVLIFLPPRYHLLFKIVEQDSQKIIHIKTDFWPILAYVDDFLANNL